MKEKGKRMEAGDKRKRNAYSELRQPQELDDNILSFLISKVKELICLVASYTVSRQWFPKGPFANN